MPQIKNILFPVDFSERTCDTAPFVTSVMNAFAARATLLYVVEPLPCLGYGDGPPIVIDLDAMKCEAEGCLEQSLVKEFAGLPVKRAVQIGSAADTIVDFAEANGVDLIMLPTRGRGPFRAFLLGSVTSKVLHDARCPVWTAAHVERPAQQQHTPCRSILCAVDGSANSVAVLGWAADYAKNLGASLRVVHVVTGPNASLRRAVNRDLEEELRRQAETQIEELLSSSGIAAPLCIGMGDVGSTIAAEAAAHHSDLLIIGRGVIHQKLGRLRTHSYEIIRTAHCPVISV